MAVGGAVAGRKAGVTTLYLTNREHQMIEAVCDALTNREIGEKFKVSEETVKRHLSNIFDKIGCSNRVELAMMYKGRNRELRAYICELCGTDRVIRETNDESAALRVSIADKLVVDALTVCPACMKRLSETLARTIGEIGGHEPA